MKNEELTKTSKKKGSISKKLFMIIVGAMLTASVFLPQQASAQAPSKMSYQAVVRNGSNTLESNQGVGMQISILQGSATGTVVYVETQTPTTNANGLVSVEIGTGSTSDDFTAIDWANGPYFIQTETDLTGGTTYTITGTSQLMSVPYALYAASSGSSSPQTLSQSGNTITLSNGGGSVSITDTDTQLDAAGITALGFTSGAHTVNTNTQLGEPAVDAFVANNGYLTSEVDGSVTNEIELPTGGTNGQVLKTDGSGTYAWVNQNAALSTTTNVTSNAPGDYATDDFVFGSPQLDGNGNSNNNSRMFFDKSKGAFRVGYVSDTKWDDANRGIRSVAMGTNTTASGGYSTAMGAYTISSGNYSIAMGIQTIARSFAETTIGLNNTDYTAISTSTFNLADRLFVVGNGANGGARSDALIIYKSGDGTLAGTLLQLSDARLKKEVAPLKKSLSKLMQLQGVHYKWNSVKPHDTTNLQTGLIAQEVEKILPELVKEGSDGYKSVNYIGIVPYLVEAIKELEAENKQLKIESVSLRNENEVQVQNLEIRLLALEKLILSASATK